MIGRTNLKPGDKVRYKHDLNKKGIVDTIHFEMLTSSGFGLTTIGLVMLDGYYRDDIDPDCVEVYFDKGDIVVFNNSMLAKVACVYLNEDNLDLSFCDDTTKVHVPKSSIRHADFAEKNRYYKLRQIVLSRFDTLLCNRQIAESSVPAMYESSLKKAIDDSKWFDKANDNLTEGEFDMDCKILLGEHRLAHPRFKEVIYSNPATIVLWEDGTKTVVKCDGTKTITKADGTKEVVKYSEGEKFDKLKGFMMCIIKKASSLKEFYRVYEDVVEYVTDEDIRLDIEKGLAISFVKEIYGIKKIEDIYKVAMVDWER